MIPLFLRLNFIPSSLASKLRRVDWIGTVIFIGSTTSFLIPITWGGVMYAWTSWRTLVPLIIGAIGLVGFVFWEVYGAAEPLIRLSIFSNRSAAIAYFIDVSHPNIFFINVIDLWYRLSMVLFFGASSITCHYTTKQ
jgi:hypothetical protein